MTRKETIQELSGKFLQECYEDNLRKLTVYCDENRERIRKELQKVMAECTVECRKSDKKINYVILSPLESSIITKSYELMVAVYDENMYLDRSPVRRYWKPDFLFQYIEEDFGALMPYLHKKVIRLKDFETAEVRRMYVLNYIFLAVALFQKMIPDLVRQIREHCPDLAGDLQVAMGMLMEKPVLLYGKESDRE